MALAASHRSTRLRLRKSTAACTTTFLQTALCFCAADAENEANRMSSEGDQTTVPLNKIPPVEGNKQRHLDVGLDRQPVCRS